ncbi:hypothetical protein SCP_0905340 [Sparassis crispa]|uniref:Uncharacterized protein n=1 Tax=Sparassis crispa TaxID=139825 RepID=A0A401GXX6_9APHY|nr:hypothetical protein SCP_0905340 [Sparassis crispa]GBE86654.1 hypothetical protein SCP_0905340 [Sparassis crispa]
MTVRSFSSFTLLEAEDLLYDEDALFSVSTPTLSALDSALSFNDVVPFPSDRKPLIFTNLTTAPIFASEPAPFGSSLEYSERATITVPTGPRLRTMLLEPICVSKWAATLRAYPPPNHVPWQDSDLKEEVDFVPAPWIAEGSILPREALKAMLRSRRGQVSVSLSITVNDELVPSSPDFGVECSVTMGISMADLQSDPGTDGGTVESFKLPVPTIMVSNSTAILPLSLESSQSLAYDVPLAVRRGKKVPPPLTLSTVNIRKPKQELDAYPGIPSPFLGSPSSSSPTFEFSVNPTAFSMGLEAMCADLRSRCPDFNLSPPINPEHSQGRWRTVLCSQPSVTTPTTEDDEWAFAKDLLDQYICDARLPSGKNSPQSVLHINDTELSAEVDSFSWASSATFVNSVGSPAPEATPETSKQQRRKTVIIETPDHRPQLHRAEDSVQADESLQSDELDEHEPVPFESPSDAIFSCSQCRHSTPPQSRPASSTTLRPVRGILKEKKTVRFSVVHNRHEHSSDQHINPVATEPVSPISPIAWRSVLRQGSPLRQSYSPASDTAAVSLPAKGARAGLPKHPVVRAIPRSASRRGTCPSPQTPTPALLADQRRAPLRSINMRQSLPAKRSSQAVSGMAYQGARPGVAKQDIGKPKRLLKTASTPVPAVARQDENTPPRPSRMPVPFRTILTRFRP